MCGPVPFQSMLRKSAQQMGDADGLENANRLPVSKADLQPHSPKHTALNSQIIHPLGKDRREGESSPL